MPPGQHPCLVRDARKRAVGELREVFVQHHLLGQVAACRDDGRADLHIHIHWGTLRPPTTRGEEGALGVSLPTDLARRCFVSRSATNTNVGIGMPHYGYP